MHEEITVNMKLVQAKSISDELIVSAVANLQPDASRQRVIEQFPEFPAKIVTSKLRQATLKKLLVGCASDSCARQGKNGCGDSYRVAEVAS